MAYRLDSRCCSTVTERTIFKAAWTPKCYTLDLVMNYNILSGQQFRNRGGGGSEALASPRQSICSEIN